jgi:hypothetical protein
MKTAKKKVGATVFSAEFVNSLVSGMQGILKDGDLKDTKFRQQVLTELAITYLASQGGTSMDVRWAAEGLMDTFKKINCRFDVQSGDQREVLQQAMEKAFSAATALPLEVQQEMRSEIYRLVVAGASYEEGPKKH